MVTRRGENVRLISVRRSRDEEVTIYPSQDIDREFDSGEKIVDHLDLRKARRVGTDAKRVNVDFPAWMVDSLDREARRLGVTRQSLIKLWLAEKLGRPVAAGMR